MRYRLGFLLLLFSFGWGPRLGEFPDSLLCLRIIEVRSAVFLIIELLPRRGERFEEREVCYWVSKENIYPREIFGLKWDFSVTFQQVFQGGALTTTHNIVLVVWLIICDLEIAHIALTTVLSKYCVREG